jgi:hypothetical protein
MAAVVLSLMSRSALMRASTASSRVPVSVTAAIAAVFFSFVVMCALLEGWILSILL